MPIQILPENTELQYVQFGEAFIRFDNPEKLVSLSFHHSFIEIISVFVRIIDYKFSPENFH